MPRTAPCLVSDNLKMMMVPKMVQKVLPHSAPSAVPDEDPRRDTRDRWLLNAEAWCSVSEHSMYSLDGGSTLAIYLYSAPFVPMMKHHPQPIHHQATMFHGD